MFDAAPLGDTTPSSFLGQFEAYMAGPLVLGGTAFDGHRYGRDAARLRRDGLNHYHINLHLSGGYVGRFGDQEVSVGPGDITMLDFARPLALAARRSALLVIAVPREAIELRIPEGDHHGLVLRGNTGLGSLLGDHLRSLVSRLPIMTAEEATAAASGSIAMIAACFQPTTVSFASAQSPLLESLAHRIRRYIALNLREGSAITPDSICGEFRISRASLYRLFEPFGGVSAYIQNQRLSHAFTILMNPLLNHRKISEVAFGWGFSSESHFSRAFRKTFGIAPREVRALMQETGSADSGVKDWLSRLRRL